ncbi:hypothetical protein [Plebeiibacterium marinum]|uniref:SPOR domain-containing protein n=1 Tax=Plebeiibacterium marinum TaxID=2992111 RepID=A0AAE3MCH8_9BACT|nr:hypothetical protein [Plebeiobacterium marinum]MCW3805286.1 hypothetical protein [Plebeiobacterium marinum]
MTAQEIEFENRKEKLRQDAVFKEVQRLRKINRSQSSKIAKLRKAMYFQILFFISLLVVFLLKGMISFGGAASNEELAAFKLKYNDLKNANKSLDDSIEVYKSRITQITDKNMVDRNETGLRFRVQIGAFKEINLNDFSTNLVAINQETYDSINQYTIGVFKNYEKAKVFLEDIKRMGFNDSFIISTKNGRRIPIDKLSKEELYPNLKNPVD